MNMVLPWLERRLAVVVGVNSAPHARSSALQEEPHATNDAEQMSTVLHTQCGFELLQPALLGAEASSDNVKRALLTLADQRTGEDFLLFYFSGHGHLVRRDGQNDVYLVTHNFDEREARADENMHLSMRWLQKHLYHSASAGKVLLILDCCYAGEMGRTASDPYLEELKMHLQDYFGPPKAQSGSSVKGLRLALTATGHMQLAHDKGNNGVMTGLLLPALRGEVDQVIDLDNHGYVPLPLLQNYLQREMPKIQNPSVAGDFAGKECMLAQYEQRAEELRKRQRVDHQPDIYLPFVHNPLFQPRPDELDGLAKLPRLLSGSEGEECSPSSNTRSRIVALVGMGGIGKTSLSIELALLCQKENRFPAGIFWMPASATDLAGWRHQLAALALHTHYLSPDDHPGQIENEERRAHYFCLYLAQHPDTLLILDNVVKPELIQSILLQIAGKDLLCTILYTSRDKNTPRGVLKYEVEELKEENALHLLLDTRPETLLAIKNDTTTSETEAALTICRSVSYLPLALEHLRALLEQDEEMEIVYLQEELLRQGTLGIIEILDKAFLMSWNLLDNEQEKQLFKIATRFPEAVPIPLWLLGLATGLGEDIHMGPLGNAYRHLVRTSMLETLSNGQVRLHPLLREFGHRLLEQETQANKVALLAEAERRLVLEFANANKLEKRVQRTSYWTCLGQVREARNFLHQLGTKQLEILKRIERWLDRESSELAHSVWWPGRLPGLFYQRMYNRALEEGTMIAGTPPAPWLRLEKPSGAEDPALLRILIGHTDAIKCVAFSPDGRQALTGSYDKTARLWNSEDGRLLLTLQGRASSINSVAFSPDGKRLCTASDDNMARVWDGTSGEQLLILQGHTERINSIIFSRDGNSILTGSSDKTARLWDSQNGKLLLRFTRRTVGVQCVAFSEQQPWIMAAGSNTARIWDKQRGEVLFTLDNDIINGSSLTFSLDGRQLVVASPAYTASIIDCEKQKVVTVLTGHIGWITCAAISHDGRFILTGSEDNTVRLWDSQSGEALLILANHTSRVSAVAFSADGRRILSGSADKTARIWEYDGEVLLAQVQSKKKASPEVALLSRAENTWSDIQRWEEGRTWISRAAFSKSGARLVTGNSYDSSAHVWDSIEGTLLLTLSGRTSGITSVAISADGRRIFTGSRDRTARIWDGESGKQLLEWSSDYDATSSVFSPNGRHILTNMDTQAALWDSTSGKLLRLFDGHTDKVRSAVFSPDGTWILTGSNDRTARVWNSLTGERINILNEHESSVMCALFTPDGQQILTTDRNQNLRLWSKQSGKLLKTIPLGIDIIHTLAISDDSELIAVCDTYGRMLLLQGKEPGQGKAIGLYAAPYEIRAISWLEDNSFLLVDRERVNDKLHFYRLKLESLLEYPERIVKTEE